MHVWLMSNTLIPGIRILVPPHLLNLRLLCLRRIRVWEMICSVSGQHSLLPYCMGLYRLHTGGGITSSLPLTSFTRSVCSEQHNRASKIKLERFTRSQPEKLVPPMRRESFPALANTSHRFALARRTSSTSSLSLIPSHSRGGSAAFPPLARQQFLLL